MAANLFATPLNNTNTTLASNYTAGANVLALTSGAGFPALTGSNYYRVTVMTANLAYSSALTSANYTIYKATAISGNNLTIVSGTPLEGTSDRNYVTNDVVEIRVTAGTLSDIHSVLSPNVTSPGAGATSEAFGASAVASATSCTSLGNGASASGTSATGIGKGANASGASSTIVGASSASSATNTVAIGTSATANSNTSIAIGSNAAAGAVNEFRVGSYAGSAGQLTITNAVFCGGTGLGTGGFTLSPRGISSTTTGRNLGNIAFTWATATDASRMGRVAIFASDASGTDREGIRIESSGSAPLVGFYGATAVAQATSTAGLTAAGTYGANEQTILNDILTILRNLGFCT